MVVATTVALLEQAAGLQIAGGEQQDGVAVDDVAVARRRRGRGRRRRRR